MNQTAENPTPPTGPAVPLLVIRSLIGGVLMGLANLVPGISGGTMLVAAGIYQRFIDAIADLSTFKFRFRSMLVLGIVAISVLLAIGLLAGPVKNLVVNHRWIMYSIFIGLTLGGVPVIWKMVGRPTRGLWIGAVFGFAGMALLAVAQSYIAAGGSENTGFAMMLLAGAVAAGAMILPGVSGGYLFLVMGVYVSVLAAIDQCKQAAAVFKDEGFSAAWAAAREPVMQTVLPVGIGVALGIVVISNLLKILLHRFEKPTLGVLIGLLFGAVVGLWPFQQGAAPQIGDTFRGQIVTAELLETLKPEKFPTEFFTPTIVQAAAALGLTVGGFAATALIARLGRDDTPAPKSE